MTSFLALLISTTIKSFLSLHSKNDQQSGSTSLGSPSCKLYKFGTRRERYPCWEESFSWIAWPRIITGREITKIILFASSWFRPSNSSITPGSVGRRNCAANVSYLSLTSPTPVSSDLLISSYTSLSQKSAFSNLFWTFLSSVRTQYIYHSGVASTTSYTIILLFSLSRLFDSIFSLYSFVISTSWIFGPFFALTLWY